MLTETFEKFYETYGTNIVPFLPFNSNRWKQSFPRMQELHGIGNDIQDLINKKLTALMKSL